MERRKGTIKQRVATRAVKIAEKKAIKASKKKIKELSEKHEIFINNIKEMCGSIIEQEPEKDQSLIVSILCTNILQGFDTIEEIRMVIDMIQTTMEEYFKIKNIP